MWSREKSCKWSGQDQIGLGDHVGRPDVIFVKMSNHFELKVCIWGVI